MKLTVQQFKDQLESGQLAISLIGMSNCGKGFWTKRLEKIGFRRWSCDDEIELRLGKELKELGYQGIADVAKWMGQPYEERSAVNQQKYLEHEIVCMKAILKELQKRKPGKNWAIDTTGSVIYTGEEIASELKKRTLIVWIQATPEMKEEMFKRFLEKPKPILWLDQFQPLLGEGNEEALRRCYPQLLEYRTRLYAQWADVTIPHHFLNQEITGEKLLEKIKTHL